MNRQYTLLNTSSTVVEGVTSGPTLYVCSTCSGVISEIARHDRWHERFATHSHIVEVEPIT
jgi:hypothetical protein